MAASGDFAAGAEIVALSLALSQGRLAILRATARTGARSRGWAAANARTARAIARKSIRGSPVRAAASRPAESSIAVSFEIAHEVAAPVDRLYSDGARTPTALATAWRVSPSSPSVSRMRRPAATIASRDVFGGEGKVAVSWTRWLLKIALIAMAYDEVAG